MSGKSLMLLVIVMVTFVYHVFADSPWPPYSHSKQTPDGKFLFVMLVPTPLEFDEMWGRELEASEIRRLRTTYPESGLYRNDGSTIPLWTVDWYAHGFEPFSDGIHLVRKGPWASSPNSEAISFFANGVLIRSYTVRDLVANPDYMPHTVSHFTWRSYEWLNDHFKTYTIITKHIEYHLFDVTTGEKIISINSKNAALSISASLLCGMFGYLWWRRIKHA